MLVPILRGLLGKILTLRGRKGNNSDSDSKGSRLYYLDSDYEGWRGYDSDAAALLACGRLSPTIDKLLSAAPGCLAGEGRRKDLDLLQVFVLHITNSPPCQLYLSGATYICLPARFPIIVTRPHLMTGK